MSELIGVFPTDQAISSYVRGIVSTQPDIVSELTKNKNNNIFTNFNLTNFILVKKTIQIWI